MAFAEFGEEVHFEGAGEFRGGAEGDVDVAAEDFRDVGTGDVHALGERGLVEAEILHPAENLAEEEGADVVEGRHEGRDERGMRWRDEGGVLSGGATLRARRVCRGIATVKRIGQNEPHLR